MTPSADTLNDVLDLVERLDRFGITNEEWQRVKPEIMDLLPPDGPLTNGRTRELRALVAYKLTAFKPSSATTVAQVQPSRKQPTRRGGNNAKT